MPPSRVLFRLAFGLFVFIECCPIGTAQNIDKKSRSSGKDSKAAPLSPVQVVLAEPTITETGQTLQEPWAIALSVDPNLEASRWQSSAAQRGLCAVRAERLPPFSARASYSVFDNPLTINAPVPPVPGFLPGGATASVTINQREFFLGGVQATQPLYTFGRISSAIAAARANVTAAVSDEKRTHLDIKLQVAAAYIGVLQSQRLLDVAKAGVTGLKSHERQVKNRIEQGAGIRANLLAVQVALANARQFQLQMQNLLAVARASYNRALQQPLDSTVELQDLVPPTHPVRLRFIHSAGVGSASRNSLPFSKSSIVTEIGCLEPCGKLSTDRSKWWF